MNIFNRRNSLDDDLPGRPRPRLPQVEDQIGDMVKDQFTRPSLEKRRDRIDFHLREFIKHHDAARREAESYLLEHDAMINELEAEKNKVLEHMEKLNRLAEGMPRFGGKDEEAPSDASSTPDDDSGAGEDPVQSEPEGRGNPLPFNRR
jgi:hypothetical protein